MQREIITADEVARPRGARAPRAPGAEDQPPAGGSPATGPKAADDYASALMKLIPGEAIGVYTALIALSSATLAAGGQVDPLILLLFLGFGVVFTPIYLKLVAGVHKPLSLILSTVAFVIYVYAQGDWFEAAGLYMPLLGAAVLIMAGALLPILAGVRPRVAAADQQAQR